MSELLWNDIIKTYDEQFHLLEYARSEYAKIVDAIVVRLSAHNQTRIDGVLEVTHSVFDGDIGKKYFRSSIKANNLEFCSVIARMVVPWSANHNMSGNFHVAIEYTPQPDFLPVDRYSMFETAKAIAGWEMDTTYESLVEVSGTERWLYCKAIDLAGTDPMSSIVLAYGDAINLALTFARICNEKSALIVKTRKAFTTALSEILSQPIDHEFQRTNPDALGKDLPVWEGFKYLEFFYRDFPSIWLFVHPVRRCLMFCHNKGRNSNYNLAMSFVNKLGITPEQFKNYPSGVILEEQALAMLSEQEICSTIVNTFKSYYSVLCIN